MSLIFYFQKENGKALEGVYRHRAITLCLL